MAKFTDFMSKLFNRPRSQLQTDAAAVPPRSPDQSSQQTIKTDVAVIDPNISQALAQLEVLTNENLQNVNNNDAAVVLPNQPPPNSTQALAPYEAPANQNREIVNNIQNNNLISPLTSITNTSGVSIVQFNNVSGLHIGNKYTMGSTTAPDSNNRPKKNFKNLKINGTIESMMNCEDELEHVMIDVIAKHLGVAWIGFARNLEYSNGQISIFENDYKGTEEQTYQFILDWSRNEEDATVGKMTKLLWQHEQKETVYYMKKVWKKLQPTTT